MMKPRLRFSLKAILVIFTIVAVWLGWNASIVHQRRALLTEIKNGSHYFIDKPLQWGDSIPYAWNVTNRDEKFGPSKTTRYSRNTPLEPYTMSTLRRWMGDELRYLIAYRPGPEPSEAKRLFPETIILLIVPDKTVSKYQSFP